MLNTESYKNTTMYKQLSEREENPIVDSHLIIKGYYNAFYKYFEKDTGMEVTDKVKDAIFETTDLKFDGDYLVFFHRDINIAGDNIEILRVFARC